MWWSVLGLCLLCWWTCMLDRRRTARTLRCHLKASLSHLVDAQRALVDEDPDRMRASRDAYRREIRHAVLTAPAWMKLSDPTEQRP